MNDEEVLAGMLAVAREARASLMAIKSPSDPRARLAQRIAQLAELRPSVAGKTLEAFGMIVMIATATLARGTDRSRDLCARALGEILAADDVPARIRRAADDARFLLERRPANDG